MNAVYCSNMGRKIGKETCDLRKKSIEQWPMCMDCKDYSTGEKGPDTTVFQPKTENDKRDISPDEDPINPINEEALKTEEVREVTKGEIRCIGKCNLVLPLTEEHFNRVGPKRSFVKTCKKCVVDKRAKNKEIKRLQNDEQEKKIKELKKELQELKNKKEEIPIETSRETFNTEKDEVIFKKSEIDGNLGLSIEYKDLKLSITIT